MVVLEILAPAADAGRLARLAATLDGARLRDRGLEVQLEPDRSPEEILALCHAHGVAVQASVVRSRPVALLRR